MENLKKIIIKPTEIGVFENSSGQQFYISKFIFV